jgi:hypothetical protein
MFRLLFCNSSLLWEHAHIRHGNQSINLEEKTMAILPNLEEKSKIQKDRCEEDDHKIK